MNSRLLMSGPRSKTPVMARTLVAWTEPRDASMDKGQCPVWLITVVTDGQSDVCFTSTTGRLRETPACPFAAGAGHRLLHPLQQVRCNGEPGRFGGPFAGSSAI